MYRPAARPLPFSLARSRERERVKERDRERVREREVEREIGRGVPLARSEPAGLHYLSLICGGLGFVPVTGMMGVIPY